MRRLAVLLLLVATLLPPAAAGADGALAAPGAATAQARAEVAQLTRATAVNDANANKLFDDLDAAFATHPGQTQHVIVSFVAGVSTADGIAKVRTVAPAAVVDRQFTVIPAFAGSLSATQALAIARLPQVRQIELDSPGVQESDTATTVMGADAVVDEMGISGSLDGTLEQITADDVTIAILDTGFDVGHADLDGKLETFVDIADGRVDAYDSDGHGTHVASIAAGWGAADPRYRGVAPGAGIVGLRIENESHAIAGYQWILENRDLFDIRVATISFGFGVATDGTTALERAVDAVWNAGVVCFKSNGNSGPNPSTMTVPAAARGIIAMGSLLDTSSTPVRDPAIGAVQYSTKYGFVLSEYSSRGPTADGRVKPVLVAPGEAITAADAGTAAGYTTLSGTSMASPFGAGTAALVLAANPALQPDEVRDILIATAEDFGAAGPDNEYGNGRIQVWHAVKAAADRAGLVTPASKPPAVPQHRAVTSSGGRTTVVVVPQSVAFPLAVTAISSTGVIPAIAVTGPDGRPVPGAVANADRQHHFSFQPTTPGIHAVEVVSAPGTQITVDVSYGLVPPE